MYSMIKFSYNKLPESGGEMKSFDDIIGYSYKSNKDGKAALPYMLYPVRTGCNYVKDNFSISRGKEYQYFTLHIVISGYSFFEIDNKQYLLKKGDAFIIISGEEHKYYSTNDSGLGLLWMELECSGARELMDWYRAHKQYVLESADTQRIAETLAEILRYQKNNKEHDDYKVSEMCYALIMELYRIMNEGKSRKTPAAITGAIYYINSHFSENISIKELVDFLKVSESYLNKKFHEYMGTSPGHFILLKKIEYAVFLLKNTTISCEDIAEKCGFYDATHLYKVFMKNMGVAPSSLRN